MRRDDWPVLTEGIRLAGKPNRCFYCDAVIGQQHGPECVIRSRTVVVKAAVTYTVNVPEHWTADDFEFHRNESSFCSGVELVLELRKVYSTREEALERGDYRINCLCPQVEWEYVREATPEDEARDGVRVAELPT